MLDCMKKYKMVLSSLDGEVVYKSDSVHVIEAEAYDFERNGRVTAEIRMTAREVEIETAEKPPEMPLAATAAKATKIIQEEKRKAALKKEWTELTDEVCKAIKKGESYIYVNSLWMENEKRLIEMGYEVSKIDTENGRVWKIRWAEPFYLS